MDRILGALGNGKRVSLCLSFSLCMCLLSGCLDVHVNVKCDLSSFGHAEPLSEEHTPFYDVVGRGRG